MIVFNGDVTNYSEFIALLPIYCLEHAIKVWFETKILVAWYVDKCSEIAYWHKELPTLTRALVEICYHWLQTAIILVRFILHALPVGVQSININATSRQIEYSKQFWCELHQSNKEVHYRHEMHSPNPTKSIINYWKFTEPLSSSPMYTKQNIVQWKTINTYM